MKQYPSYIFTASQGQQYEWLKLYYPDLFEQIQKKVSHGQWELIGGVSICFIRWLMKA
jgi:alpha-mannosidase